MNQPPIGRTTDPDGRVVVFDAGTHLHLAQGRRAWLLEHVDAILATVEDRAVPGCSTEVCPYSSATATRAIRSRRAGGLGRPPESRVRWRLRRPMLPNRIRVDDASAMQVRLRSLRCWRSLRSGMCWRRLLLLRCWRRLRSVRCFRMLRREDHTKAKHDLLARNHLLCDAPRRPGGRGAAVAERSNRRAGRGAATAYGASSRT
jgi:hypothetical protein